MHSLVEICDYLDNIGQYKVADNITEVMCRLAAMPRNWLNQNQSVYDKYMTKFKNTNVTPYNGNQYARNQYNNLYGNGTQNLMNMFKAYPKSKPKPSYNIKRIPQQARQYTDYFTEASKETGYPVPLLLSLAFAESSFNATVQSPVGAYGLMQLYPANAQQRKYPRYNILGGARKLKSYHDKFGNLKAGLAAYNWGPGNMSKVGGDYTKAPQSVQDFVNKVINGQKKYA